MDSTPVAPTARLLGFLAVSLGVGAPLWALAGGLGPWGLVPLPFVWLAVVAAGAATLAPRPWLHRAKWIALATAVVLAAAVFVFAAFVAPGAAPPPLDGASVLPTGT